MQPSDFIDNDDYPWNVPKDAALLLLSNSLPKLSK
jgi:hypothetical protein